MLHSIDVCIKKNWFAGSTAAKRDIEVDPTRAEPQRADRFAIIDFNYDRINGITRGIRYNLSDDGKKREDQERYDVRLNRPRRGCKNARSLKGTDLPTTPGLRPRWKSGWRRRAEQRAARRGADVTRIRSRCDALRRAASRCAALCCAAKRREKSLAHPERWRTKAAGREARGVCHGGKEREKGREKTGRCDLPEPSRPPW